MRQNDDMRRTAHKHAFCNDCGYCLFGLTDRCPECGRRFDPADLFSFAPPPQCADPVSWAMAVVVVFVLAIVAAIVLT